MNVKYERTWTLFSCLRPICHYFGGVYFEIEKVNKLGDNSNCNFNFKKQFEELTHLKSQGALGY
jgi:hypothetical protein